MTVEPHILKSFLLVNLESKCEADVEVLADYIVALVQSLKDQAEFYDQLHVFLGDHTSQFITELFTFINTNLTAQTTEPSNHFEEEEDTANISNNSIFEQDEIEVDYEETEQRDQVVTEQVDFDMPMRQLREYSPERTKSSTTITTAKDVSTLKKPCISFQRFGRCRFANSCRFSHDNGPPVRKSTRVRLSGLPPDLLKTDLLTEKMSGFGSVTSVFISPERNMATVQFATSDEAQSAVDGARNIFEDANICAEIQDYSHHNQNNQINHHRDHHRDHFNHQNPRNIQHQHGNSTRVHKPLNPNALPFKSTRPVYNNVVKSQIQTHTHTVDNDKQDQFRSLLNLQKQQQGLLDTYLSSQQSILSQLESQGLSDPQKGELIGSLAKIQETVGSVQGMLKSTTEMMLKHSETRSISRPAPAPVQAFRPVRAQRPPMPSPSMRPQYNNHKYSNTNSVNSHPPPTVSYSLDLRPNTLKLSPLPLTPLTDIHALQRHFAPFGPIQSLMIVDKGDAAIIKYQRHDDAHKAVDSSKQFDGVELNWIKQ